MTVFYLILGIAIAVMAFLMITLFVSLGPLLFLLGLVVSLVVFVIILVATAFLVYKAKNFICGDIAYYDFDDFAEEIDEDLKEWYENYKTKKQNKKGL